MKRWIGMCALGLLLLGSCKGKAYCPDPPATSGTASASGGSTKVKKKYDKNGLLKKKNKQPNY